MEAAEKVAQEQGIEPVQLEELDPEEPDALEGEDGTQS